MKHDAIAVVDFGGQYAHLIATKVRRQSVLAEIRQPEDPLEDYSKYKGIILSGGPSLLSEGDSADYTAGLLDLEVPIIGFCFGHQEIAMSYGGKIEQASQEWGHAELHVQTDHPLFEGLGPVEQVWMSHFDSVVAVGEGFIELGYTVLGSGDPHRFAAIANDEKQRYGFQFHPEVDDTKNGDVMITNFVKNICKCEPSWTMDTYLDEQMQAIRNQVGDKSVFLLASGGVDSTVAAVLIAKAIGPERLSLLHVDNGLMRKDESARVIEAFKEMGIENVHFIDATADFLGDLAGKVEPEEKRHAIGHTFVNVFNREAKTLGLEECLLGQGTIYPDTIETGGTKRSDTIKTHHNRVKIIEELSAQGKVIEPLSELYKVEVRELGEALEIPSDMIWRHPFPGPGLGVRLLCGDGKSGQIDNQETVNSVIKNALDLYGLSGLMLPFQSVGVKADVRTYEHPVLIHGEADYSKLKEAAGTVFKTVPGVNRVIWNLGPSLPEEVQSLPAEMTAERLDLLREADFIVMQGLKNHGLYDVVWQCPTVLVPLSVDGKGEEFCIIRPVVSERAMTATAAEFPKELVQELSKAVLALPGISGFAYDLTSKPPGTIEWE